MENKTQKLINKVCKKWDFYKSKEVKSKKDYQDYTSVQTLNGYDTNWDNPNILWLLVESEDWCYDGSGIQVGLTKEGKIVWEYQSHCSCNSFEDSNHHGDGELCLGCAKDPKSYELNKIPNDWEKIIKVNLEEILEIK